MIKGSDNIIKDIPQSHSQKLFLTQFLYSHEVGVAEVSESVINNKVKQVLINLKKDLRLNSDNRLIINTITKNINKTNLTDKVDQFKCLRIPHRNYSIGSYIYLEQMIDYNLINRLYNSPNISLIEKEKLWKVNMDNKGNIFLREPTDGQLNQTSMGNNFGKLTKDKLMDLMRMQNVKDEDFQSAYNNNQFKYIPIVVKENNQEFVVSPEERNKELVTKVLGFEKFFPCKILGVTESEMVIRNEATNEISKLNLSNPELLRKTKLIEEDMFGIYDLSEIDNNTFENLDNYSWKISFSFINSTEKEIFIHYLKQLRRSSTFKINYDLLSERNSINVKHLLDSLVNSDDTSKCLKIFVDKIEFRHALTVSASIFINLKLL